jgi:hypothetical protein
MVSMQHRLLVGLTLSLACTAGMAQVTNPIDSAACRRTLDTLEARESAAAAERASSAARAAVALARRQAALACLGGPDIAASTPQRAAPPPVLVTPSAVTPRPPAAAAPSPRPPPAPRAPAPPVTIGACDATGCWASDGTRLQRAGPNLLGPRGVCTTSGPFVQCP